MLQRCARKDAVLNMENASDLTFAGKCFTWLYFHYYLEKKFISSPAEARIQPDSKVPRLELRASNFLGNHEVFSNK